MGRMVGGETWVWGRLRPNRIRRESICRNLHQRKAEKPRGMRTQLCVSGDRTSVPPETILKRLSVYKICPFIQGKIRAATGSDNRWCDFLRFLPFSKQFFLEATLVMVKNFSYLFLWKGGGQKRILITKRDMALAFELVLPCKCPNISPCFIPFSIWPTPKSRISDSLI